MANGTWWPRPPAACMWPRRCTPTNDVVFLNEPGCSIKFTEEEARHEALRNLMKERFGGSDANDETPGKGDDISGVVTREETLEIVAEVARMGIQ